MKLLILDGNSILNRAFYGIKLLTTKDGRYSNAIYGFLNILLKLEEDVAPDSVAVTFDLKEPTFRHKMYDGYKAGRKPMPPELAEQMPVLKEILSSLGYKIVTKAGYEADDLIGTLSHNCGDGNESFIATGDRDSLQLVSDNVTVLLAATRMGRPETVRYDVAAVKEKYGVEPAGMIDIKALMGDSSDNIPGVSGIGEKTASSLVSSFGSIDNIYENIDSIDIKESVRTKLKTGKEKAYLSYKLGKIDVNVPIDTDINSYKKGEGDPDNARKLLTEYEMFKILERLDLPAASVAEKKDAEAPVLPEKSKDISLLEKSVNEEKELFFAFETDKSGLAGICAADSKYVYEFTADEDIEKVFAMLQNTDIKTCTYNSKAVYSYFFKKGEKIKDIDFDILLGAYLLNPSAKDYSVKRLAAELSVPYFELGSEALSDVSTFRVLKNRISSRLESTDNTRLFNEIEMPLAKVLSSMEVYGIKVDRDGIEEFSDRLSERIEELQREIYSLAGREFNINSPKQLGEVLFDDLAIPAKKKTKTGYSTNADVLEGLAEDYEIVRYILEYRTLAKLKSTYCDGLIKEISADGRIHTTFNQTETRTGRISSVEPNLQNIPVRTELGREMRKFFVAEDGMTFIDADYSQIELRVLSDIADDKNMIDAFNSGTDIHTTTASQVFKIPLDEVSPLMRSRAKAVNFGIVYGIGAFSLSKDIGVSRAEADKYIKDYLHHYSGVDEYMKSVVEKAKADGYVSTLFGRRRYLPELSSSNGMLRSFGERVARNMPIQGTAADIIKIAMIRVYNRLKAEKLKARLLLQVHDELIVEAPESEAETVKKIVSEEMENACKMKVRLVSDANIDKTWYDAKG